MEYIQTDLFGTGGGTTVISAVSDDTKHAAIEKIRDEMVGNNNPYVQVVGTFLLKHLNSHPQDSENILTEGKTVSGSLQAMQTEAEKKKVGNVAVLTDAEGFAIVLEYFGIQVPTGRRRS